MYKRVALTAALLAAGLISVAGRDRASPADAALQRAVGRLGQGRLRRRADDVPGAAGRARTPPPSSSRSRCRPESSSARPSSRPTARTRSSPPTAALLVRDGPRRGGRRRVGRGAHHARARDRGRPRPTSPRSTAARRASVPTDAASRSCACRASADAHARAGSDRRARRPPPNARRARRRSTRLIARTGRIVVRDLDTGRDEEIDTGDLLKTGVTCAADGAVLFAGALESETDREPDLPGPRRQPRHRRSRRATASRCRRRSTPPAARCSSSCRGRDRSARRPRAAGAAAAARTRGGRSGRSRRMRRRPARWRRRRGRRRRLRRRRTSFGILTLARQAGDRERRRAGAVARRPLGRRGSRAPVPRPAAASSACCWRRPTTCRRRSSCARAPSGSTRRRSRADGARVAFQMMPKDDWEIYLVGRDGKNETRVTREIQHDLAAAVPRRRSPARR